MTLADTGVLIDFLAGPEPAAERVAHELESGNLWTNRDRAVRNVRFE
jgi:hypothetical protein